MDEVRYATATTGIIRLQAVETLPDGRIVYTVQTDLALDDERLLRTIDETHPNHTGFVVGMEEGELYIYEEPTDG